jgi:hypothetical protein
VERAPFFVVEEEGKEAEVFTVYFKFAKEVLPRIEGKVEGGRASKVS